MENLVHVLREHIQLIVADVEERSDSDGFDEGVEQYFSLLQPSITRYQHHQGSTVSDDQLRERLKYETALLHLLTKVFASQMSNVSWPVHEQDSPYHWYDIHPSLLTGIDKIRSELLTLESPALALSQISEILLYEQNSRVMGEFYTPRPIAQHLLTLSALEPSDLLEGKRVIDPACGGGIILLLVVNQFLTFAHEEKLEAQVVLTTLSQNLFGFDIQPFAVALTRTLLIYSCRKVFGKMDHAVPIPLLPNIQLQDTLTTYEQYWAEIEGLFQFLPHDQGFDYIIGNPPFMSAKKVHLDYITHYEPVLSGHPNLYQLFLWWAVRATKQRGTISFLVPQSMLSGYYFRRLRTQLQNLTTPVSITRMIDHQGVVGDANLQMMAVCLKKSRESLLRDAGVDVRVTQNGDDISQTEPINIPYSQVIQRIRERAIFWVVSENRWDYTICERLDEQMDIFANYRQVFKCGNGNYVWNQHKELLGEQEIEGSLPLISATSIELYDFVFPYKASHASYQRQFSRLNEKVSSKSHSPPSVLIQRTTRKKVGRRLVVGMTSEAFCQQYSSYFIENHVIYIKTINSDERDLLYGLVGWLNSDLINFIFQLRNGTASVSVYELESLPINLELVKQLVEPTRAVFRACAQEREARIKELNQLIYTQLDLNPEIQERIAIVLQRQSSRKGNSHHDQ